MYSLAGNYKLCSTQKLYMYDDDGNKMSIGKLACPLADDPET